MDDISARHGHRDRLRQRFISEPETLSESELLELILTYAIPRRDVAPIAKDLLARFENIAGVLSTSYQELKAVDGIGEQAAILINAISRLERNEKKSRQEATHLQLTRPAQETQQPKLFEVEPDLGPLFTRSEEPKMRSFVDDEIKNAIHFLPKAKDFETVELFQKYLEENLPYNSYSTRQRRATFILSRYFPERRIDTPLTFFAAYCSNQEDLKSALFYETSKAEPLLTKTAEEFIWPALPIGHIDREVMRQFIQGHLPDLSSSSQNKVLNAIFKTYDLCSVGEPDGDILRVRIHKVTLEGFLYVLAAEYSEPGVYSFESLNDGPMRHWLLWDKEWIRQQLYNLQDYGIIAKVSEIDRVRQFTTQLDQMTALRTYFEHPQRGSLSIRERES